MADRALEIDLFVEDVAHERLLECIIARIASEERAKCRVRSVLAKGGRGRVLSELELYLRVARAGAPDMVVIGIDANCHGWAAIRRQVEAVLDGSGLRAVIACPDPHIERWYLGDPPSLAEAFGVKMAVPRRKCNRDVYKELLTRALRSGENEVILGGIEYAEEIVEVMDLFRAGKAEASLRHFVSDLRAGIRAH
jgi:hypothetical protein